MTKLLLIDNVKIQEVQMGQEITIGRAYSNLLRLEGEEVSRVHAILYRRGKDFILRDLDSKNGVLLNGHKVINCTVSPGDAVQIGKYHIVFEPPPNFDLAGYLRRNRINIPPEVVQAGRDMDTGSGLPKVEDKSGLQPAPPPSADAQPVGFRVPGEGSQQSVNFRAVSDVSSGSRVPLPTLPQDALPEIFFGLELIERILEEKEKAPTPEFSADLIRLHRGMSVLPSVTDSDEGMAFHQHLLELIVSVLKADRGVIIFYDTGEVLRLGAIVPRDRDVSVNRVVLRAALREHRSVLCNDAQNDSRFLKTDTIRKDRIGSLISYPLVKGGNVLGLIYCDAVERTNAFRPDHLGLLRIAGRLLMMSSAALRRPTEAER